MRQTCEDTGLAEYAQGHANAFGLSISSSNIDKFIEKTNKIYEGTSLEPIYWVDYIWNYNEEFGHIIEQIVHMKKYWGQEIPEPMIAIKDIPLSTTQLQFLSPDKHPTIKIHLNNGVDLMKFKSSEEEFEQFDKPNALLTIVGTCNINEWNGRITPQIIIEDYDLSEKWVF